MSLQFSILKVLAGQPEGRATLADLNRTIHLLSGPEWTARMKRLAARAPDLDIFGACYVVRDDAGWQLTDAGRAFLSAIETPAAAAAAEQVPEIVVTVLAPERQPPAPPLRLVADNRRLTRRTRGKDRGDRSAVA